MAKDNTLVAAANEAAVILSVQEAIDFLVASKVSAYDTGTPLRPIELVGPPGVGKTAVAKLAAAKLREIYKDFECVVIAPSTTPADELGGIPMFTKLDSGDTTLDYALPRWLVTHDMDPDWHGFIVLDDARQCMGDQQKVLSNLIYERTMRGRSLPVGASFVLTGNRMTDRAGVAKELTHYSGRKATIHVDASVDEWTLWAVINGISDQVIGYVNFQNEHFNAFDPNREKNPNPRTWHAVSNWQQLIAESKNLSSHKSRRKFELAFYSGEVGPGIAHTFSAFCDLFGHMPDIDEIIRNPTGAAVPSGLDMKYAITVSLAGRANASNLGNIITFAQRISNEHTWLIIVMACSRNEKLGESAAVTKYLRENSSLILGINK